MFNALLWNLAVTSVMATGLGLLGRWSWLRTRPAVRHSLWLLLLIKLVTPPLIPVPVLPERTASESVAIAPSPETPALDAVVEPAPAPHPMLESPSVPAFPPDPAPLPDEVATTTESVAAPEPIERAEPAPRAVAPQPASPIRWNAATVGWLLAAISACGAFGLLGWTTIQSLRVSRWLAHAGGKDPSLTACCESVGESLGLHKLPQCLAADARLTPLLWGVLRPVLVVPQSLIRDLSPEQLRCVVAHELAHYLRRDHWTNAFVCGVRIAMWWNPFVWWAHREVRAAQELCCDAIAIDHCERRCYASTLLHTLDFVQSAPRAGGELALPMGPNGSILRRFEMIADTRLSHRLPLVAAPVMLALILLLACVPVHGQQKRRNDDTTASGAAEPEPVSKAKRDDIKIADLAVLSAIIAKRGDKQASAWVQDRATGKRLVLSRGQRLRINGESATVLDVRSNEIELKIDSRDEAIVWSLGKSFGSLLVGTPSPDEVKKAPAKWKDDTKPVKATVQFELVGDQLIVRGGEKDIQRVMTLLKQLNANAKRDPYQGAEQTFEVHQLRSLDPMMVVATIKTLLPDNGSFQIDADPKTNRLLVRAPAKIHKEIRELLAKLEPAKTPAKAKPGLARFRLSFRNQPWIDVLNFFAQGTNRTLILDETVPGTFSFSDEREYNEVQTMDVLNSVLITKGFALVQRDHMLHLVNLEDGMPKGLAPPVKVKDLDSRGKFEFVSVMFPLKGLDGTKVRDEVAPLLSRYGRAILLSQSKQLMVTDRGEVVRLVNKVIESIPETAKP